MKNVVEYLSFLIKNTHFENYQNIYIVGGYVRDLMLNKEPKDIDLVVNIKGGAKYLADIIKHSLGDKCSTPIQLGQYPIWSINFSLPNSIEKYTIEIAETMKESFPDSESRQRNIEFSTLEDDILRRDFTINSMLIQLSTGNLICKPKSIQDLNNDIIDVNDGVSPEVILSQDPLRIIRAIRFAVKENFSISNRLQKAIVSTKERLSIVSNERIRDELIKIMEYGKLRDAIMIMVDFGILEIIMPEVHSLIGCEHNTVERRIREQWTFENPLIHGEGDVFDHTMKVLEYSNSGIINQLAALCHDLGKPKTQEIDIETNKIRFLHHPEEGEKICESMLSRLKFDSDTINIVKKITLNHMRPLFLKDAGNKAIRKFIRECSDIIEPLFNLVEADEMGTESTYIDNYGLYSNIEKDINYIDDLQNKIKELSKENNIVLKKPILSGTEIMEYLNIPPGKAIGIIQKQLQELVDENGDKFTKEKAYDYIKLFKKEDNYNQDELDKISKNLSDLGNKLFHKKEESTNEN